MFSFSQDGKIVVFGNLLALNFCSLKNTGITLEHKWQFQIFPNFEMAKHGFYPLQRDRIPLNYGLKWSRSRDISI